MTNYTFAFTASVTSLQQNLLRLIRQYNLDENVWKSLEGRRRVRRQLLHHSRKQLHTLDIAEFARTKLPEDCIGRWL